MKRLLLPTVAFLLLIIPELLTAQENIWNNAPSKGFVFEITNNEAEKLLTHYIRDTVYYEMLHTLVDTFDVEKGWVNQPDKGHFILVKIVGNKLYLDYTCVFPYQVFLFREYNALSFQVLDLSGNVREDARVKIKRRRIRFDSESKTYRLDNQWANFRSKFVTIELDSFRSVFDIEKHEVPTWNKYYSEESGPDFYSYMISDKNKYKPNEEVRFKSYALSAYKWPLRKKLDLYLTGNRKRIKIKTITPYRPGAYAEEFHLHDSLNLDLDRNYTLQLQEKTGRIVASCSFRYEDYELFGNKLEIQLEKEAHYYPDNNILTISATNENGLMLKDARAEIQVTAQNIKESFHPYVVLPKALMIVNINLDPSKPTEIEIPSSLFGKSNTVYVVEVVVVNSQNERLEKRELANHYYSHNQLETKYSNDSICFNLLYNNKSRKNITTLLSRDGKPADTIQLPYQEKINPAISYYYLENEFVKKQFSMAIMKPELKLLGGIELDSFKIQLDNPHKLLVSYYIYKGSTLLEKGFGKEINHCSLIEHRSETYYVDLLYSFGGLEHNIRRQYVFKEGQLQVSLDIPDRVYPGQVVDATINVTNQLGHPVSGVDLTALAVTSKLNYHLPDLPNYGSTSSARSKEAHYTKTQKDSKSHVLDLPYEKWKKRAFLDTMLYYKFSYPDTLLFKHSIKISDSTQFAPFVMEEGDAKEIYVIEVDNKPVYFSWTNQLKDYSFYIKPDTYHIISLRLWNQVFILDSICFEAGTKTIFSFDIDKLPKEVSQHKLKNEFSDFEGDRYRRLIAAFKGSDYQYSYLESEKNFIPLFNKSYSNKYKELVIGPLFPGKINYVEGTDYSIHYWHENNFIYSFSDNVVYKQDFNRKLPAYLVDKSYDPVLGLNDLKLTKQEFMKRQQTKYYKDIWNPRSIVLVNENSQMKILLPHEVENSGVGAIVFRNCSTGEINCPWFNTNESSRLIYDEMPVGYNNACIIYNNGSYLKMDSIPLEENSRSVLNFQGSLLNIPDSVSLSWLSKYHLNYQNNTGAQPEKRNANQTVYNYYYGDGNVRGTVYSADDNFPLPGVTILIKGTTIGTVTDIDGRFSLHIEDERAILVVSFVGCITEEIGVEMGAEVAINMKSDVTALEEVIVVGYGIQRKSAMTGAISVVSGDIQNVPEDELEEEDEIQPDAEQHLYNELLTLNSIRSNFSDVGFWEPRLFTDKNGKSTFTVTFPDDITRWDAVVYGMNRRLQTGTVRKSIKSYKPIMAQLHMPRFLTSGDSAMFIGKVLNYSSDSILYGNIEWSGASTDFSKDIQFSQFHSDKLLVNPCTTDSITCKYTFTRSDGYFDGEQRTIPVIEQGVIRSEGTLDVFYNGEERRVVASEDEEIFVEILDNQIDIYAQEVRYLINYRFACNEQLASKLIGLINNKIIAEYEGKNFNYDYYVKKIIRKLLRNQNKEFLWSWWNKSPHTSHWMSAHILRALKYAKDAGYNVNLNIENVARKAGFKYDYLKTINQWDVELLHSLAIWGVKLEYPKYLALLDSIILKKEAAEKLKAEEKRYYQKVSYLKNKLLLQEIRQLTGDSIQKNILFEHKKVDIMGDVYFSDGLSNYRWYNNDLTINAIAYRIVKRDSSLKHLTGPMQMYFLSSRKKGGWNTYHSSNIVKSVLPDIINQGASKEHSAAISVIGKENAEISEFPYRTRLGSGEELVFKKNTGMPVYFMQYTKERVTQAKTGINGFEISTHFENFRKELKAGEPVKLIVDVTVNNDAASEYVMIEVPIPGSCSYADKRQPYSGIETHREYFKDRTVIFCQYMKPGTYRFSINLLPRFTGNYIVNPAQVSLMYVPVVNANTDMKKIEIVE